MEDDGDLRLRLLLEEDNGSLARPVQPDPLDPFFEELELEQAGGPVLPPRQTRLRGESMDPSDGEPLEKVAGERRKQGIAMYLKRCLAMGEDLEAIIAHASKHSREIADLMRAVIAEGLLEIEA